MPLRLLLDENISPVVAEQIALRRPDIPVLSLHAWRDGVLMGASNGDILAAARDEAWTLVTYDTQMLSDVAFWFEQEIDFHGLIFIDDASIPGDHFGALVRALIYLWDGECEADWRNRLLFLPKPIAE